MYYKQGKNTNLIFFNFLENFMWLNVIQYGKDNRPHLIALDKPKNLLIDGITLLNSPQYHIIIGNAFNTTILNVAIRVSLVFNSSTAATFPLNTGL